MSNDDFAVFLYRMVFIGKDDSERVIENRACLVETNFVVFQVRGCFRFVLANMIRSVAYLHNAG